MDTAGGKLRDPVDQDIQVVSGFREETGERDGGGEIIGRGHDYRARIDRADEPRIGAVTERDMGALIGPDKDLCFRGGDAAGHRAGGS